MSSGRFVFVTVVLFLTVLQIVALSQSAALRIALSTRRGGEVMPAVTLRLGALEFDGMAADLLQLTAMVGFGEMLERGVKPTTDEWRWLHGTLFNATELDPYFLDPYIFGNAVLTWDAQLYNEANALLEKGSRYRTWDYLLPFYLGFNQFYFLKDPRRAGVSLMESARRPGATPLVAALAVRMQYQGNQAETATIFLQEILRTTDDPATRKDYEMRLQTLQQIVQLEKLTAGFAKKFGRQPMSLRELVKEGWLKSVPLDPYGGSFYLAADGSVKTTSDLRAAKRSQ